MKLITTFKSLLTEIASLDDIKDSINKKIVVTMYYDGDEPGGKGYRVVEPVAVGYSKGGNNLVLRAWDLDGASHKATIGEKPLPSWRLFRVDKILTYQPTTDSFTEVRPNYNPTGDNSMINMLLNATFDT